MAEEDQVTLKGTIFNFMKVTDYVVSAIKIQDSITERIKKEGTDAKTFFENHSDDQDIHALNYFNSIVESCTIYTVGLNIAESTNVVVLDQWGDFLRIWFNQGDPQIFVMQDVDTKNNTLVTIRYFFGGQNCYQYQTARKLTEEEIKKISHA